MEYLTVSNPLFSTRIELGLANWGTPQYLKFYRSMGPHSLDIPVGALPDICDLLVANGSFIDEESIIDQRITGHASIFFSTLKFTGILRPYQQDVVNTCMSKTVGIVEALTGSGKSIVFIALIVERKEPTLILVHTLELAAQVKDALLQFTNIKEEQIGLIGDGIFTVHPVTIALHQSMSRLDDDKFESVNNMFGMIIADEVQNLPAATHYATMSKLKAKYKFGFSSTPERTDGLTKVIHFASGPIIHKVKMNELKDVLILPTVKYINTNYFYPLMDMQQFQNMISDLASNEERNKLILDTYTANYKDKYVCMLCTRIDQVLRLKELIGNEAVILYSKMPKKERKLTMILLRQKKKKVIIATYSLFGTGIDLPHLDALFMCAPVKSTVTIKQAAGRLMRKSENKTSAEIVDFVDNKIDLLKWHAYKRKQVYKTLKW